MDRQQEGEMAPTGIHNVAASRLNPSTHLESKTVLQRTWLRAHQGDCIRRGSLQSLQRERLHIVVKNDGLQHEETTQGKIIGQLVFFLVL